MPAPKLDKVRLACPHCGNVQAEPRSAISSVCKKCGEYFRVQEVLHPVAKAAEKSPDQRRITCFDCHAELDVPRSAESTMCKKCSRYIDLKDYVINSAVSKNFKTKGNFVIESKGYVFNTEVVVASAVIKGRFLGKIFADESLTIYSSAEIKGSLKTCKLIIPAGEHLAWSEKYEVNTVELGGELVGNICVPGKLKLQSTARLFGDLTAQDCIVEEGAVVVGCLTVGQIGRIASRL